MVVTYKTTAEINAGITVDPEKRVYHIPMMVEDDTLSVGYANITAFIEQFSAWLTERGYDLPPVPEVGTVAHYLHHIVLGTMIYKHWEATGEQFREWLILELIGLEGKTLEVVTCRGETQRFTLGITGIWAAHHTILIPGDEGFHPVIGHPFQSIKVVTQELPETTIPDWPLVELGVMSVEQAVSYAQQEDEYGR